MLAKQNKKAVGLCCRHPDAEAPGAADQTRIEHREVREETTVSLPLFSGPGARPKPDELMNELRGRPPEGGELEIVACVDKIARKAWTSLCSQAEGEKPEHLSFEEPAHRDKEPRRCAGPEESVDEAEKLWEMIFDDEPLDEDEEAILLAEMFAEIDEAFAPWLDGSGEPPETE